MTLLAYLVLARLAAPSEFGDFAAAAVIVNVGLLFTESGMLGALIQRESGIDAAASTATVATLISGLAFSLFALVISPLVGQAFDSSRIAELSAAMSGMLLLRSLRVVPEALLQRRLSFLRRMIVEPAETIAFGTVAIVMMSNGMGAWGLVCGYYAGAVVDVGLSWGLAGWRPRISQVSFRVWRELIAYGRHLVGANIVLHLYAEVPTLLIGRRLGTSALGQFKYADRMASTPHALIVNAGSFVLFPALARITTGTERFAGAFLRAFRVGAAASFLLGGLLVPFGVSSAMLIFGEVWEEAGRAAMPLGAGITVAAATSLMTEAFKAAGRPQLVTTSRLVTAISGTVFMLVLASHGLVGIAIGIALGNLVGAIFRTAQLGRLLKIAPGRLVAPVWPAAVAAAVMVATMLPLDWLLVQPAERGQIAGLALLASEVLLACLIYAAALALLAPATIDELRRALGNARRR